MLKLLGCLCLGWTAYAAISALLSPLDRIVREGDEP